MLKEAKKLIPSIKSEYVETSNKVGIRPQLFNKTDKTLVKDFLSINDIKSTHILNGISPAFTASFELADLIVKKSGVFD